MGLLKDWNIFTLAKLSMGTVSLLYLVNDQFDNTYSFVCIFLVKCVCLCFIVQINPLLKCQVLG